MCVCAHAREMRHGYLHVYYCLFSIVVNFHGVHLDSTCLGINTNINYLLLIIYALIQLLRLLNILSQLSYILFVSLPFPLLGFLFCFVLILLFSKLHFKQTC